MKFIRSTVAFCAVRLFCEVVSGSSNGCADVV